MKGCDYCNQNKTVPKYHLKKIYKEIKKNKSKKIFNSFIILNLSFKQIVKLKIYIPFYSEELIKFTRKKINFLYNDVGIVTCNICKRDACPSHFLWSNFYNGRCVTCNKLISVCGWCKSNKCFECNKTNSE
jgi:hypothetical protein